LIGKWREERKMKLEVQNWNLKFFYIFKMGIARKCEDFKGK